VVSGQWAVFSGRGVAGADLRGEDPLEAAVQSHGWAQMRGVFFATDEHGFSRMNRRGIWLSTKHTKSTKHCL